MKTINIKQFVVLVIILVCVAWVAAAKADPPNKGDDWRPPKYVPAELVIDKKTVDRSTTIEQDQSQEQSQQQTASAINEGNHQDVSFANERQAPAVGRGSLFPTANCMGAADAGLSIPGGSFSGGKTYVDEVCRQLEWIKAGYNMGMRDAAIWEWCSMEQGRDNPYCHTDEFQDYKAEVIRLQAENELLHQDVGKLADEIKDYCRDSNERVHKACQEGK